MRVERHACLAHASVLLPHSQKDNERVPTCHVFVHKPAFQPAKHLTTPTPASFMRLKGVLTRRASAERAQRTQVGARPVAVLEVQRPRRRQRAVRAPPLALEPHRRPAHGRRHAAPAGARRRRSHPKACTARALPRLRACTPLSSDVTQVPTKAPESAVGVHAQGRAVYTAYCSESGSATLSGSALHAVPVRRVLLISADWRTVSARTNSVIRTCMAGTLAALEQALVV